MNPTAKITLSYARSHSASQEALLIGTTLGSAPASAQRRIQQSLLLAQVGLGGVGFITLPPIVMEVKNGCISNSSYPSNIAIFRWSHGFMGERVLHPPKTSECHKEKGSLLLFQEAGWSSNFQPSHSRSLCLSWTILTICDGANIHCPSTMRHVSFRSL